MSDFLKCDCKIEKLKEFLIANFKGTQTFSTKNTANDPMVTVYEKDDVVVDYCPYYDYIEIFGLTKEEYQSLNDILDISDYGKAVQKMSKAVLISIQPKWCELIASGKKTVEIRKTKPKLETPFKCYIYCTKAKDKASVDGYTFFADELYIDCHSKTLTYGHTQFEEIVNGKVIGEFVCDKVAAFRVFENGTVQDFFFEKLKHSCLSYDEIAEYIGRDKAGYSWHISDLVIYDKPKGLSEFQQCHKCKHTCLKTEQNKGLCLYHRLNRPPQSWCYVESEVE